MKRILVLVAIALLTFGLLGSAGCSKKVSREADISAGDYYTEEEFAKLDKERAEAYCADLAAELERLNQEAAKLRSADHGDPDALKSQLAQIQSRIDAQNDKARRVQEQIDYFESLPKSYRVVRGDCLWNISKKEIIYADPFKWPWIYEANKDQISDPDLIYPDQVFDIPR